MSAVWDTIVIGGGQAGLAAGYHLQKKGLRFLILEAGPQATGSWTLYYDSLKLFSPARFCSLPGMKFPKAPDQYPSRDEVIRYLQQYAIRFQLPIMTDQRVKSVEKEGDAFMIRTTAGKSHKAFTIVNATGSFHRPYTPVIEGQESYNGRILHSSGYRRPDSFAGQRVVVVGRGNSAVQIAVELSEVSRTSLAVLRPVQFVRQKFWGLDMHVWIRFIGLDTFPFWRIGKKPPIPSSVIDLGRYRERISAGQPDQRLMFKSFYEDGVVWSDGTKEPVDNVIFATGYRPHLEHLKSVGALDSDERPAHVAGVSTAVPGLYYVGLEGQRSFASATLRGVGPDAEYVVRKLKRFLHQIKK